MEKEMFMQLDEHEIEAFNAAARTQKLLQLSSGAVYLDPKVGDDTAPKAKEWRKIHDVKLEILEDIVEEAGGTPIIVAYHFRSDLARLQKHFPKARVLDKNPSTISEWNAGKIPILLAHPQSAGHGLNLQDGGNILVFFSHNWALEDRLQIIERIGPMRQLQSGHNRPVYIYNILARDTMDELVLDRVNSKREVQDILLDAMRRKNYK
jgi:SNF2 family DNA or RNA helicase